MRAFTGMALLVRLVLRRDRIRLPLWIAGVSGLLIASAASLPPVYPDQESIEQYVRLFGDNPALVAFAGPGYGFDDPNLGVILVNETQTFACIAAALMSIFLVNRHTRAEEDAERTEVLRSSVVGRHAPTAAAVAVVSAANVVVAGVCAVGCVALGYDAAGSVALAGSVAACGLLFTAITAAAAQIAGGSRPTLGLASLALGAAFVLRAVGDIGDNAVRWLSPMGWAQGVRAFADERWWVLGACVVFAGAVALGAFWLSTQRDLGSGMVAQRPGPPTASRRLVHPLGLAVRLQRGSVLGWALGLFLVGLVYGSIGQDVEEMMDNEVFADVLAQAGGGDIVDSFLATSMSMLALLGAGFAISSALRLRSEESAGRAEPILAATVSRNAWVWSHLTVALGGTVVVMAAGGLGIGLAYGYVVDDAGQIPRMLGAAVVTLPAVFALVGVAVALFGLVPRAALAAWAALAVTVVVDMLGELLRLPAWTRQVSPLHHVPAVPAEELRLVPLAILLAVAAVLVLIGMGGFRSRDLRTE